MYLSDLCICSYRKAVSGLVSQASNESPSLDVKGIASESRTLYDWLIRFTVYYDMTLLTCIYVRMRSRRMYCRKRANSQATEAVGMAL